MEDFDKTIPPRREHISSDVDDVTMPGRRDRKPDGRFAVGDLIMGRYKVLAELGQGGMGVVYKCFDETAGVEIALKALPPELSHNSYEMEDIKENFQLVAKLVHQNIAISKQLEKDNANGNYYLIMEYCDGEDLRRWVKRKRREGSLTLDDVLPIVEQIADALDYAHKQKIIHRDIKPGNIMINAANEIKVLDFGLAAQIHTSMTRVSMAYHGTSGTGPYMAPEQWRGRAQGAPADQYALAVLTYEMLAGHLPFESADAAVLREAVLNETPADIADIPKAAQEAIKRAMSKEPAERFANCSDFAAAMGGKKVKGGKTAKAGKAVSLLYWTASLLIFAAGYYFLNQRQQPTPQTVITSKTKQMPEQSELSAVITKTESELPQPAPARSAKAENNRQSVYDHAVDSSNSEAQSLNQEAIKAAEDAGVIFSDDKKSVIGVKSDQKEKIVDVVIPEGVTAIAHNAFKGCDSLQSITIPGSVEKIGSEAFVRCTSLQSITIPGSVKEIGQSAFSNCTSLRRITIPGSVEKIGDTAFSRCESLQSIIIPGSVEKIGEYTFFKCESLESVTINDGVKEIGDTAFWGCDSLQSIDIPGSVEKIGDDAFWGCTSLQSIDIPGSVKKIGDDAFHKAGCEAQVKRDYPHYETTL